MQIGQTRHPLEVFFAPRSVAVIGASERAGSVGRTLMWNLVTNPFGGTVFPFPGVELTETGCRFEIEGRPGVGLCEMLWPEGYRTHLETTWGHLGGR